MRAKIKRHSTLSSWQFILNHISVRRASLFLIPYSLFLVFSFSASAQRPDYKDRKDGDTIVVNKKTYTIHKCLKDETMFGIAAKYHVKVNDLENANKDVINNLKKNTVVLIPVAKKKEELKKEEPKAISPKELIYKIALLIPFNEGINYTTDSTLANGGYLNSSLDRETVSNLEFYEGVLMAVDGLKKQGFKTRLSVFDAHDAPSIKEITMKPEVKEADVIITNLPQALINMLNGLSGNGKPVIISCGANTSAFLTRDSSAFFTSPSSLLQCRQIADYLAKRRTEKDKFIIINSASPKEVERAKAMNDVLAGMNDMLIDKARLDSATQPLKPVLSKMIIKGKNNIVIVPSSDEAFVSHVMTYLKSQSEEFEITLIGLPTWQYFQSVNPEDFQLLHATIFTSVNIDYQSSPVVAFRKTFREKYFTEPSENAFSGYDAMMFLGDQLLSHGVAFREKIIDKKFTGLSTDFHFVNGAGANGLENNYISVLQFKDYSLKTLNR